MDVAISGASGLIGSALRSTLADAGHRAIGLVRRAPTPGQDEIGWQPAAGTIDGASLEGIDAIVNLAGAGIADHRWTDRYRRVLVDSRVGSTELLAGAIAGLGRKPSVFLTGSAIGYYGSRRDEVQTEQSPPGDDFLARLCVEWEAAAGPAIDAGIRTVPLRTGIVLSTEGGALPKLLPLFKLFVGGRFGRGDQYLSWITIDDLIGAILHVLTDDIDGPVNLTAPQPVTNAEFTSTLARVLGRPALVPVPAFAPRLIMGAERANALLFDSIRVEPAALKASGFAFATPELEAGLRSVLRR